MTDSSEQAPVFERILRRLLRRHCVQLRDQHFWAVHMFALKSPGGNALISMVGSNVGVAIPAPAATLDVGGGIQSNSQLYYSVATAGSSAMGTLGNPASDRIVLLKGTPSAYPYALGVGTNTLYASVPTGASVALQVGGATVAQATPTGFNVGGLSTLGNVKAGNCNVTTLTATGLATLPLLTVATSASITGLTAPSGVSVPGTQVLNFGSNIATKEASAGRIGYQTYDSLYLDIVGAGTVAGQRGVKIYDNLMVGAALSVGQTSTFAGVATHNAPLSLTNSPSFTGNYPELANKPLVTVFTGDGQSPPSVVTNVIVFCISGSVAGNNGQAILYATNDGSATGAPLFSNILSIQATCALNGGTSTGTTGVGAAPYCSVKYSDNTTVIVNVQIPQSGLAAAKQAPTGTPVYVNLTGV